jgi:PAS domain S-box-containing protein
MTGSIHRGTASEPQDRSSSAAHSIEVPPEIVRKWQEFVNLLAEIMHVPSASIMRVDPPHIKVFVSSTSKGNPCEPGALDTGPYCETVMKTGQPLLVPDARENEAWKANPHVRLGMISYLGFPIGWPDGRLFGTICVRDNKRNEYSEAYLKLLLHFRDMLQADLKSFATLHQHEAKIRRLVDSNIIGIFVWDFDGRILEANDELLRMVSYDREDLVSGRVRWADLTPPDWRDRNNARIEQQKSSGRFEPFEKEFTRRDGSRVPILIGGATFEEGGDQGVAFVLDLTERKCAEEALRESERSARSALDGIAGLVAIMTPNGEVETVNRQCVEYFGRPVEEQRDWVTTDMVHPEDLRQMLENFKKAIASEIPYHFEQRLRRFDGEYRWFETRGGAVRDDTGRIVRWYVLLTDIEDRKRAEEALQESEAKFRDYAESASDWYWETDPDHKFTHLTEDERRLARGVATVSRIGVARWEFATDVQSEPEKWELHRSMLEARQPFRDFVYRATHSDGSVVYNRISGKPVFDSNGEFHGYRGTGSDVTELMRAQEQQTAISEVLRAIVNSPYDLQPIFDAILDSATRLCQADSGALRLSEEGGLRLVAVRGDPFLVSQVWSSIPVLAEKGSLPDRLAASRLPTHIPDFTAVEGDHRDDFSIRVANAGIRTGLFVPLLKDNEIVGIISLARKQVQPFTDKQISLFRDFAAQATIALESTRRERQYREAQMALAHANRVATMGQLTASITHEVNQPITAAVTYALAARRWLSADPPNFREVEDALSLIVKEGDRAGEVVKRVRALVKKVPTQKGTVAIDDAILEVIALTRTEAANNSVSVRTQFAEGLPRVQGDRVQLQQVMLNLIVNAIQAMSGIGEGVRELQISIETVPSAGGVRVGVRDTGPGLSPESVSRLFEPFYTTKPDGMGMGLSICRTIIEAHGGRLWATGCEPRGALFQFTIPAD